MKDDTTKTEELSACCGWDVSFIPAEATVTAVASSSSSTRTPMR